MAVPSQERCLLAGGWRKERHRQGASGPLLLGGGGEGGETFKVTLQHRVGDMDISLEEDPGAGTS